MVRRYYPPAPKEDAVQMGHAKLLNLLAGSPMCPKFLWWHTPNGEARSKAAACKVKALGGLAGVWDITILAPGGRFFYIEEKRPTKTGKRRKPIETKLSKEQREFRDCAVALGIPADHFAVVDDVDGLTAALRKWGLMPGSRAPAASERGKP